jgi:hypothetical protein
MWDPIAILLQKQKAWSWKSPKVANLNILVDHFKASPDELFFKPPAGTALTEVKVPLLLAVPPHVIRIILNHRGTCKPVQLYSAIKDFIQINSLDPTEWALVLTWCRAAQHADSSDTTSSTLAQFFTAITIKDENFQTLCAAWLDFNFGPRSMQFQVGMPMAAWSHPPPTPHVDVNALVSKMACIVSASQALLTNPTLTIDTKGHTYTEDQVAMVMGLACVTHPDRVPVIWMKCFSATKNPDVIRFHLKEQMQQWALAQGTIINGAVHFPKQLLIDIAMLRFNLGGSLTSETWIRRF